MKRMLILAAAFLSIAGKAMANPACVVCTVAIGASLEIARKLGICDEIVGLWAGAMFAILGYWSILLFDKKNWHFLGRNVVLMGLNLAMIGFIYLGSLVYTPRIIGFLYIDSFLLAGLCGAVIYIFSQKLYQFLKIKNGGHAHFPFEKVALPVALLFGASLILNIYPL